MDNSLHTPRDNKLAVDSTPSEEYKDEGGYDSEDGLMEGSDQGEPERISLLAKLMMGCAILTLIVPVVLLVIAFMLLSLAQQP